MGLRSKVDNTYWRTVRRSRYCLAFGVMFIFGLSYFILSYNYVHGRAGRPRADFVSTNWSQWMSAGVENIKDIIKVYNSILSQPSQTNIYNVNKPCFLSLACSEDCPRPLAPNSQERLKDVLTSPNLTLPRPVRESILSMVHSVPESDVIIVSASSSNHYFEMQAMFHNLHTVVLPLVPNVTIILFDLGLTIHERLDTEKFCHCHVISFPFRRFPRHVRDIFCFSWKPLLVRATISKSRHILVYQDTSVRWTSGIVEALDGARRSGVQYYTSEFMSRIPLHTLPKMFEYFGEVSCAFSPFPELEGSVALYRNDPFVIRAILEPWARCALEKHCICPVDEPSSVMDCYGDLAQCHRFDQSAIGILTAKLFNRDMDKVIAANTSTMAVVREHLMNYFNSSWGIEYFQQL